MKLSLSLSLSLCFPIVKVPHRAKRCYKVLYLAYLRYITPSLVSSRFFTPLCVSCVRIENCEERKERKREKKEKKKEREREKEREEEGAKMGERWKVG